MADAIAIILFSYSGVSRRRNSMKIQQFEFYLKEYFEKVKISSAFIYKVHNYQISFGSYKSISNESNILCCTEVCHDKFQYKKEKFFKTNY